MNWITNLFRCRRVEPQSAPVRAVEPNMARELPTYYVKEEDGHWVGGGGEKLNDQPHVEGERYLSSNGDDYVYHNGKWLPL